jgi:alpha-D-xyloside xylohydrolase
VDEPLEIRVYTGSDGSYQLYQDDGISLDYMEEEGRLIIEFRWDDSKNMLSINNSGSSSIHLADAEQRFRLRLMPSGREMVVEYRPGMKRMRYRF